MDSTDERVNSQGSRPICRSGCILGPRAHVCAFFNSPEDEYRLLLPFVKEGLEFGEKAVHTVDPRRRDDHLHRLASAGIDVTKARQSGQFELRDWSDMHLRDGHFELNPVHLFDVGAAWENIALQATAMGLVAHGMSGFDYEKARTSLSIPKDYAVAAMFAIGHPGDPAELPEAMRKIKIPSGRRPVSESICEGAFK